MGVTTCPRMAGSPGSTERCARLPAWHGGTANRTLAPRLAMHAFYCRRDKPQQQYQKRLLRAEVQGSLSPELREMLALDDPLNDAISANVSVRSGFM